MLSKIQQFMHRPALYAPSTSKFWDDEHISKGMLEAHLDPDHDGATRNYAFVRQSAGWIAEMAPPQTHPALLDLGCGPGIYAEQFDEAGYGVTGIDLSNRSIAYAQKSARKSGRGITYRACDYLTLNEVAQYDVVSLIYCDFGVLSTENRKDLLARIHRALRPGGKLIFDVFTSYQYWGQSESKAWEYSLGGFWSASPYLCLNSLYRYDEESTVLQQHIVITQSDVQCYNVWEHLFTKDELTRELSITGFAGCDFYGDIAGNGCTDTGKQLCVIARKPNG